MKPRTTSLLTGIAPLMVVSISIADADTAWNGSTSSDASNAANWSNGLPSTSNGTTFLNDTGVNAPSITSDLSGGFDVFVGQTGKTSVVNHSAGTVSTGNGNWMFIGESGGLGTYHMTGSSSLNAGALNVGAWGSSGSTGTLNVNTSGTLSAYAGAGRPYGFGDASLLVGENGSSGTLNLQNGQVNSAFSSIFGVGSGSSGTLNVAGGTFNTTGTTSFARGGGSATLGVTGGTLGTTGELWIGQDSGGTATATQSGGTVNSNSYLVLGRNQGAAGTYTMTGGTVNAATSSGFTTVGSSRGAIGSLAVGGTATFNSTAGMILGEGWTGTGSAQGTLTLSGSGLVQVGGFGLELGNDAAAVGTVNLNGGTLSVVDISRGAGTGNFHFNGGTLKPTASSAVFMSGLSAATVKSGGAAIDTNGFDIAIGQNLLADGGSSGGGLTKTGAGSLTLTGTSTYTGVTSVTGGRLVVNGGIATSALTSVSAGAILGGSGTLGSTTLEGTHSPGNSPGVQTVDGNLTYAEGANLVWELIANSTTGRGTSFDGIDVTGNLTFSGATTLDLSFALAGSAVDWSDTLWDSSVVGTSGWRLFDLTSGTISGLGNLSIGSAAWADGSGDSLAALRPNASFTLFQDGNDLYLNYTNASAIPEPGSLVGLGILLGVPLLRRRRA